MNIKLISCVGSLFALSTGLSAALATFDNLPSPPARTTSSGLQFTTAPGDGLFYAGVVWDSRVTVVGDQYKLDSNGPLFGLPRSGNYFITNGSIDGGDGITLTTTQILTSVWFGRNEYYGFGGGAHAITITALANTSPLGSVSFNLPETAVGQPEVLSYLDTSLFLSLHGITGYRIERETSELTAPNWVADDFEFTAAPIPEPSSFAALAGLATLGLAAVRRRRA